ncbi:MAG TPA: ROK family transcriptional regulator [Planctomycetota bacterium]|nr:ROK family transcriptional regulator [Planctomycetota bacterium]
MRELLKQRAVLQLINSGRATSQIHISQALLIARNTVNDIIQEMLEDGLIEQTALQRHGRGRPIQHYRLRQRKPIIAIQWHGSVYNAALFKNGSAGTLHRRNSPLLSRPSDALRALQQLRDRILQEAGLALKDIAGIVLALNAVKTRSGSFSSSVIPWVRELTAEQISEALGCTVRVDLTNTAVAAEMRARSSENAQTLAILNVGDGVSAHGESVEHTWGTRHTFRGELGHIVVDPSGPQCGCGNTGCLEALISGPAMLKRVEALPAGAARDELRKASEESLQSMFDALERVDAAGDRTAEKLVGSFLDRVGWGLGTLVNVVGPDVVVLTGYALQGRVKWHERVRAAAVRYAIAPTMETVRLESPRATVEDQLALLAGNFVYLSTIEELQR